MFLLTKFYVKDEKRKIYVNKTGKIKTFHFFCGASSPVAATFVPVPFAQRLVYDCAYSLAAQCRAQKLLGAYWNRMPFAFVKGKRGRRRHARTSQLRSRLGSQRMNMKMYNRNEWKETQPNTYTTFSLHKKWLQRRYHNFSAIRVTFVLCAQLKILLFPN